MGGCRTPVLEPYRALVLERLTADPDLTIPALVAQLAAEGVHANRVTLWRPVRSSGMTVKKTLFASERDRPWIAWRRAQWRKYQGRLDPRRLVFIDETRVKTDRTPIRGWSPRGSRLLAKAPGLSGISCAARHNG
jgi:hypothetical protein